MDQGNCINNDLYSDDLHNNHTVIYVVHKNLLMNLSTQQEVLRWEKKYKAAITKQISAPSLAILSLDCFPCAYQPQILYSLSYNNLYAGDTICYALTLCCWNKRINTGKHRTSLKCSYVLSIIGTWKPLKIQLLIFLHLFVKSPFISKV